MLRKSIITLSGITSITQSDAVIKPTAPTHHQFLQSFEELLDEGGEADLGCEDHCSTKWVRGHAAQAQDSEEAWQTRCSWKKCGGCHRCNKFAAVQTGMCSQWCGRGQYKAKPWDKKCTWKKCNGCTECASFREKQSASFLVADNERISQNTALTQATQALQAAQAEAKQAREAATRAQAKAHDLGIVAKGAKQASQEAEAKLSSAFNFSFVQLPEQAQTRVQCSSWCSSSAYSDKSWEKKCEWKECKECSSCIVGVGAAAMATEEKKGVVHRVLWSLFDFVKDDSADVTDFKDNLDHALLKHAKIDPIPEFSASLLQGAEDNNATIAKANCDQSCETEWVVGELLTDQMSDKAWLTRCSWKQCGECSRCRK